MPTDGPDKTDETDEADETDPADQTHPIDDTGAMDAAGAKIAASGRWRAWLGAQARLRSAALRGRARALLRRALPNEAQHLFALTLVVGGVCGVLAVAFHLAIKTAERNLIDRAMRAAGPAWMVWTVLTPTLGGLLAGAALTWLVPGARGSGIPQVKQAFATEGGRVRFRDAFGKFVVSAFQIGTGASLGREGPTVHICAGAASMLARVTGLPPRNMRRLLPVGVAAGIAAAFNAPIAAVTFTIEEIVGTLDQAILSGVVVAAALAAVIERGILGVHPVIEVGDAYGLEHASSLPIYALLGLAAAAVSVAFTDGLLKSRAWFRRLEVVPAWARPGVGGLVTGALAAGALGWLGTTGVTGGGYDTLGRALGGQVGLRVLLALCLLKGVATVLSYSSGGAGGIFAPSLFIGAMLGGAVGHLEVAVLGHESSQLGAFALVGMGAVFAGVVRAPITSVLIIFEMTGGYGLVLPLMLANMTSYAVARRLRPTPIYEALLEQDGVHLPRGSEAPHAVELLGVSDAMTADVITATADASASEVKERLGTRSFAFVPVVDAAGAVHGLVSVSELRGGPPDARVSSLLRTAHSIRADEPLVRAAVRMNDLGVRQLVVLDPTGTRLAGMLAMTDVVRGHARAVPAHARRPTGGSLPPPPELRADTLMLPVDVVARSARVQDLALRVRRGARAFVVREEEGGLAVLLPEHLDEFARDEELERVLVAADVARPAATIQARAGLTELLEALHEAGGEAAAVVDASGQPIGVVPRSALASAVLEWYAHRA